MATLPVSVVIPVHDREELLARAVATVRAQTVAPTEILVVDDCSTDASAAVAERLGCRVLRHEENRGAAAARNTGFAAATQDWVALLDSDDEWCPWHLETVWAQRSTHDLVAGTALRIDPEGRPTRVVGPPFWAVRVVTEPTQLVYPENFVAASGALARRAAVQAVGGYDTTLRYAEDFDLWTRLLAHGTAAALPDVTVLVREHGGHKSGHRSGPAIAQREIAAGLVSGPRDRRQLERRLGVRAWDDLQRSRRDGERSEALRALRALVSGPHRVEGVLGIWAWRWQIRRRARAFGLEGRERVAILSLAPGAAAPAEGSVATVEDWRGRGWPRRLLALLVAPPRRAVAARLLDRTIARIVRLPLTVQDDR